MDKYVITNVTGSKYLTSFDWNDLLYRFKRIGEEIKKVFTTNKVFKWSTENWLIFYSEKEAKEYLDWIKNRLKNDDRYDDTIKKRAINYVTKLRIELE